MGKINGCLKCVFIFFNVLFGLVGCLMIYLAVKATAMSIQMSTFGGPGIGWIWVIAVGIFGVSALGIFAACSENNIALKIFAGFMVIGLIVMLVFGTIVAVTRKQIKDGLEHGSKEVADMVMNGDDTRQTLEIFQEAAQCCGVTSADDWGSNIPESCRCQSTSGPFGSRSCKSKPQGSSGPSQIYAESCGETIFSFLDITFKVAMGIFFGFAATALMGLLITIFMIHQVARHESAGGPSIAMKGY